MNKNHKKGKTLGTGLKLALIFASLAVVALIGWLVYDRFFKTCDTCGTPIVKELNEGDNDTTITIHPNDQVKVTLLSTYWQFQKLDNEKIIKQLGDPIYNAAALGTTVPGSGVGTVVVEYQAVAVGQAQISASRTSCGEALRCTPDQQSYKVTINVVSRQ